jgi:hypothetical protein
MRVLSFGSPSGRRDQMTYCIGRREFITLIGCSAARRPRGRSRRAQQGKKLPTVGFLSGGGIAPVRPQC